jgi:methylaspartate ammonia-lyase
MIIANQLLACESYEEATVILNTIRTKKGLKEVADALDVYIKSSDDTQRMVDKIIMATVGVKLRNKAIQNLNSGMFFFIRKFF